jgi:hypothetical protein
MPNIRNQRNIIGPKDFPRNLVPFCCTRKSKEIITSTIGIIGILPLNIRIPSTEETTVIAGVIIPSAKRVAPPIRAKTYTQRALLLTSANNEKIPPSPLLSALSVIIIYLTVVWRVRVQMTHEIAPYINSGVIAPTAPPTIALITYKGEVPISPYTMPNVITRPEKVSLLILLFPLCLSTKYLENPPNVLKKVIRKTKIRKYFLSDYTKNGIKLYINKYMV